MRKNRLPRKDCSGYVETVVYVFGHRFPLRVRCRRSGREHVALLVNGEWRQALLCRRCKRAYDASQ